MLRITQYVQLEAGNWWCWICCEALLNIAFYIDTWMSSYRDCFYSPSVKLLNFYWIICLWSSSSVTLTFPAPLGNVGNFSAMASAAWTINFQRSLWFSPFCWRWEGWRWITTVRVSGGIHVWNSHFLTNMVLQPPKIFIPRPSWLESLHA